MTQLDPNTRVTVGQGAALIRVHSRTVYYWIDRHGMPARKNDSGILTVRYGTLLEFEAKMKRGRPRH